MSENNLFAKRQRCFLAGKSCFTLLLEFLENVTSALDKGEDIGVTMIYLDLSNAFDRVPHKRLLRKLWGYGMRGNIHSWIKDFLGNRTQQVNVNGKFYQNQSQSQVTLASKTDLATYTMNSAGTRNSRNSESI